MEPPNQAQICQNLANSEFAMLNSICGCLPKKTTLGFVASIFEKHLKHKISM
jgi:hypothetical protein